MVGEMYCKTMGKNNTTRSFNLQRFARTYCGMV